MRAVNRGLVLDHLRHAGTASRSAIAEATGLAKPTVSLIVDQLVRDGLVTEVGLGASGTIGGRPPVLLTFNARSSYLAGIHLGVRRTTVTVADALGRPVMETVNRTPTSKPATALRSIAGQLRRTLDRAGAPDTALAAVGVGLPGLVRNDGVLALAPNLGWREVPVAELLHAELGAPVVAYNAAHTSLVAERAEGAAVGADDVVLVYAGTGIGAAAYVHGRLLRGAHGVAGEFGHVPVPAGAGRPCSCGRTGCLETVASADAVAAAASDRWGARGRPAGEGPPTAADVATAATEGDEVAVAVLGEAAEELGAATAWLVNVLDPQRLVLAGGLAGAGPAFTEPFAAAVRRYALPEIGRQVSIVVSELGQAAEVRGVLLLAREHAEQAVRIVTG